MTARSKLARIDTPPKSETCHDPHRASHHRPAVSRGRAGRGHPHLGRGRQGVHRRLGRRGGVVPRPRPSGRAGRHACPARQARLCAYELLHDAGGGGARRRSRRACAARHRATSISSAAARRRSRPRSRWRGSISSRSASRSGATSSAASRAITATRWARSPSAATNGAASSSRPLLIETHHVSPCYEYRGRRADETPRQYGERLAAELEAKIEELGAEDRHRLRRRDGGRRHGRRDPAGRGLLQARPRDLRPPRRPADPGRGHVRHGPHRHAARLRAGGHRARPDGDRQGAGRRLRADRRRAGAATRSSRPSPKGSGLFQHGHTYLGHPLGLRRRRWPCSG